MKVISLWLSVWSATAWLVAHGYWRLGMLKEPEDREFECIPF